jgi:2-C-methyl-D-erythritol 4-phosphate cytidylyltransferase
LAASSVNSFPDSLPRSAAVVVAGGSGQRVGAGVAKQFLDVGGQPILRRAILPFLSHPSVDAVVVVLPPHDAADPPPWLLDLDITIVAGGAERSDSVWNGLLAVPPEIEVVLIHDGARPFVSRPVIDRVLAAAAGGAAIAALPVADTIKEVEDGVIVGSPERARLWQAQTPQGFVRSVLIDAHRMARRDHSAATDDAMLVERLGTPVRVVEGAPENIKITRPVDLLFAEALAAQQSAG